MLLIFTGERNVLESLLGTVEQQIGAQGVRPAQNMVENAFIKLKGFSIVSTRDYRT